MYCPACNQPNYTPSKPCDHCQFQGDPVLVEALNHINWLLAQAKTWSNLGMNTQDLAKLEAHYQQRAFDTEVALTLRQPPFKENEADKAWIELIQREVLRQRLADWQTNYATKEKGLTELQNQLEKQITDLDERLFPYERPNYPKDDTDQLAVINFLLEAVDYLAREDGFATAQDKTDLQAALNEEKETLEIHLGLHPEPASSLTPTVETAPPLPEETTDNIEEIPEETPEEISELTTPPSKLPEPTSKSPSPKTRKLAVPPSVKQRVPPPPRRSFAEQFWGTLLSERTLQAILFMGIFLLFAAAVSFVVLGWESFSEWQRVAIPVGFTVIFFTLGRYLRKKTNLHRSALALSAIGALLIPIDFYTIYANYTYLHDFRPYFWFITSVVCLVSYTIATRMIQSRFFGYLVVTAAGSTVLALIQILHEVFGLSLDWQSTGLTLLALGLIVIATRYLPDKRVFAEPFRYMSLLGVTVLMVVTFTWRYFAYNDYTTFHYAMTSTWWLGGVVFGWGAIYYQSRGLGIIAAFSLPVATYLAQVAFFSQTGIDSAWQPFGLVFLAPLYLFVGYTLSVRRGDPIIQGHGRTATWWGLGLVLFCALWAMLNSNKGSSVAATHAVLIATTIMACRLWQKPVYLYATSFFSLTTLTYLLFQFDYGLTELSPAFISLALLHIFMAVYLTRTRTPSYWPYAQPLVISSYILAGLSVLPAFLNQNIPGLTYAFGNMAVLSAWGAWFTHHKRPGFTPKVNSTKLIFHILTTLTLSAWLYFLIHWIGIIAMLPFAFTALAWGMAAIAYGFNRFKIEDGALYARVWNVAGLINSVYAPLIAFQLSTNYFTPALTLMIIGLLYLAQSYANRWQPTLIASNVFMAWGVVLLLDTLGFTPDIIIFGLATLVSSYYLLGLVTERQQSSFYTVKFLEPLYLTNHFLAFIVISWSYSYLAGEVAFGEITDVMKVWAGITHLLLGVIYVLYAWGRYLERWAHLGIWFITLGSGFLATAFSQGRGSSAAKAALLAVAFVLIERALHRAITPLPWRIKALATNRRRALVRAMWWLYNRPLLVAGWTVSAVTIILAIYRNLGLLGGGPTQRFWAWVGLSLIVSLYALSARLFQKARFVWFASFLVFAPWTILTSVGWYTPFRPTIPGYAISWLILAWGLFLINLALYRKTEKSYSRPLATVSQILIPFSLVWGLIDEPTSRVTFLLAIGLYATAATLTWREYRGSEQPLSLFQQTKFFYPALGLVPIWCGYLLSWVLPAARLEHYGLMLVIFGPIGLVAGHQLRKLGLNETESDAYSLPSYLTGYISIIFGTIFTFHFPGLLAIVLVYNTLLLIASAWYFKSPIWVYPASILPPVALLIVMSERNMAMGWRGWYLIGLAAIYLGLTWTLRRAKLQTYSTGVLMTVFALIALGLPPSSDNKVSALGGYGVATILYAICAFWLGQSFLLFPAVIVVIVAYATMLSLSPLPRNFYGLALYPGILLALVAGWWLDRSRGDWRNFPWSNRTMWLEAITERLFNWWGLALYLLAFGLATVSPFLTSQENLLIIHYGLLVLIYGWAIYRFRLYGWLLASSIALYLAVFFSFDYLNWWQMDDVWLRFMPVVVLTVLLAVYLQWRLSEPSPLNRKTWWQGWSHPLYLIAMVTIIIVQITTLSPGETQATITFWHTLILAGLATFWGHKHLPYVVTLLGLVGTLEWAFAQTGSGYGLPVLLAGLALTYGWLGYGLSIARLWLPDNLTLRDGLMVWEKPLQRSGLLLSGGVLILTFALGWSMLIWFAEAIFGVLNYTRINQEVVYMVVQVFTLLGLLYLTGSIVNRRVYQGYTAVGMLLIAWMSFILFIQQWAGLALVQNYTIPVGLYLLGMSFLEWQRGNKNLARWIDYSAIVLMIGSLFWQILNFGFWYFLMLIIEGGFMIWWGSARRLRRFLYAGMVGMMLATFGQLIFAVIRFISNQWIIFGLIGLLLVVTAIVIERRLDDLKALQKSLETWE